MTVVKGSRGPLSPTRPPGAWAADCTHPGPRSNTGADPISSQDCHLFRAKVCDPGFNTLWEALAALVSLRVWSSRFKPGDRVLRSDNTGVLESMASRSASSAHLNFLQKERSLDEALGGYPVEALQHIPGLSNTVADALSRLSAPEPKSLPRELWSVPRVPVPVRDRGFYRVLRFTPLKPKPGTSRRRTARAPHRASTFAKTEPQLLREAESPTQV